MDAILKEKLDIFCPIQSKRLSTHDKPFITSDIKQIDRRRNREYVKNGKAEKYYELKKLFEKKYRAAAKKYLKTSLDSLETSNPSKAFRILKKLSAQPGMSDESCSFTLPEHVSRNFTA